MITPRFSGKFSVEYKDRSFLAQSSSNNIIKAVQRACGGDAPKILAKNYQTANKGTLTLEVSDQYDAAVSAALSGHRFTLNS
jgi:multisubunit Na+/H+ antiporter MnhE subunit